MSNQKSNEKKHQHCPQCGESLCIPEYDDQECWTCGWPILTTESANSTPDTPKPTLNGHDLQKKDR